ncbi:MAG: VOC family protein [Thermoguttaceae bacterium]
MQVQPYLSFEGRCEEAIEFYKTAVGAKVDVLIRFKDSPEPLPSGKFPPEVMNKVMHASLRIGDSTVMASDGRCAGNAKFTGTSLTLCVPNDAEAVQRFDALCEGGTVGMPLTKTFFSSCFGMVIDRFGVPWMILVLA